MAQLTLRGVPDPDFSHLPSEDWRQKTSNDSRRDEKNRTNICWKMNHIIGLLLLLSWIKSEAGFTRQ